MTRMSQPQLDRAVLESVRSQLSQAQALVAASSPTDKELGEALYLVLHAQSGLYSLRLALAEKERVAQIKRDRGDE
jgi:hypothetical protein